MKKRELTIIGALQLVACVACATEEPSPPDLNRIRAAYAEATTGESIAESELPATSAYQPEPQHVLPAVPGADASHALQGFVRVLNRSNASGTVTIHAIDNTGRRFGPVTLWMSPWQARHFNSNDLENGNPAKGLSSGVGDGVGWWRLELTTSLGTRAFSYIRTPDGFVTSMHQVARLRDTGSGFAEYLVPFFNPARNTSVHSYLRLVNPNDEAVGVLVGAMDDAGNLAPEVTFIMLANEGIQLSARQLEEGYPGFASWEGRFGRGVGKREILVLATKPMLVMGMLATRSGHLTNVTQ
jgi:hypothetical protein